MARWLQGRGTYDLAWWQLSTAVSPAVLGALQGLVFGLTLVLVSAVVAGPRYGLAVGLTVVAALGVRGALRGPARHAASRSVIRSLSWLWGPSGRLTIVRAFGIGIGLTFGLQQLVAVDLATGLARGGLTGLTSGLVGGFILLEPRSSPSRVAFRVRGSVGRFLRLVSAGGVLGLGLGLVLSLALGLVLGPSSGFMFGLLAVVLGLAIGILDSLNIWIDAPVDVARAVSPGSVLRADRSAALVRSAATGLTVAVGAALLLAPAFGIPRCLFAGLELGIVYGLVDPLEGLTATAWGTFVLARLWLAMTNRLPWRLMAFLDDAHRRGVLRQVGAVYQLRHVRLQERLGEGNRSAAHVKLDHGAGAG